MSQHFQNSGCNILVNVLNSLLCFLCLIRGILHKSNIRDYAVIFQLSWLNLALTQLHESRLNYVTMYMYYLQLACSRDQAKLSSSNTDQ